LSEVNDLGHPGIPGTILQGQDCCQKLITLTIQSPFFKVRLVVKLMTLAIQAPFFKVRLVVRS
jgi:hypothetical protein